MKVKLLKIVRKRYSIIKYPNGIYWSWFNTNVNTLVLTKDSEVLTYNELVKSLGKHGFYVKDKLVSEEKAIKALKEKMLSDILKEYRDKGIRRIKLQQQKKIIYYNENTNNI